MGEGTRYASEPLAPGKFIEQINYQEIEEYGVSKDFLVKIRQQQNVNR